MKAQQRLPEELWTQIGLAIGLALRGDLDRATELSEPINHGLAALDPLSAPSLCAEIAQVLVRADAFHQPNALKNLSPFSA